MSSLERSGPVDFAIRFVRYRGMIAGETFGCGRCMIMRDAGILAFLRAYLVRLSIAMPGIPVRSRKPEDRATPNSGNERT